MTDRRKLQAEIDRVLKKVQEGTDDFEECLEKFNQNSNNPTQKEKYENDLKKEIKKLQRLRDQLKTWIQSSDIKDKTSLIENRKAIESLMERFKVVERETKTKAYSKEGLQAAEKRDLELEEKESLTEWINTQLEEFNRQVDVHESELEGLMASNRKKKAGKDNERIQRLGSVIERHRYHIQRLEMILRAVDNKAIAPNILTKTAMYVEEDQKVDIFEVLAIQDDVDGDYNSDEERPITFCNLIEYYLKRCSEDNFKDVLDVYEQLDEIGEFSLLAQGTVPAAAAAAAVAAASASGSSNPSAPFLPPAGVPVVSAAVPNNSAPQTSSTVVSAPLEDKDNERDSRERERSEQSAHASAASEELSQEDSRKRHKSEEKNAQRAKANQQAAAPAQSHSSVEKSTSVSSKNNAAAIAPAPAVTAALSATQLPETPASVRVPTPPSSAPPATVTTTPRPANAGARAAANSYAKSVAGGHDASAEPTLNVQLSAPLSYSTVVSSPGISYAAVAAIASSQPPASAASNVPPSFTNASSQSSTTSQNSGNLQNVATVSQSSSSQSQTSSQIQTVAANLFQSASSAQSSSAVQAFPPTSSSNNVPPTSSSPQSTANQNTAFGSQTFGQQIAYPLSASPFGAQQSQVPESEVHNPPSLASQAHAAAVQNNVTAESLALAMRSEQSNSVQLRANLPNAGINTQNSLPQQLHNASNSPGPADITSGATFGVNSPPTFGPLTTPAFPPSSAVAQMHSAAQASVATQSQGKVTVKVNPVLGITPFGLKDMPRILNDQHDLVERARKHLPFPTDSERARICLPRVPVVTPAYYPQQMPAVMDSVEFFSKQPAETLFFVFYYMEGTKAQLLAARALKQQQWRYHSKYLMWFQRLTEPTHIGDDQETGTYIYFDYERWQTKRKEQFTFEYRYLEDKT